MCVWVIFCIHPHIMIYYFLALRKYNASFVFLSPHIFNTIVKVWLMTALFTFVTLITRRSQQLSWFITYIYEFCKLVKSSIYEVCHNNNRNVKNIYKKHTTILISAILFIRTLFYPKKTNYIYTILTIQPNLSKHKCKYKVNKVTCNTVFQ